MWEISPWVTNMTIYNTFKESCLDCVQLPSVLKQNRQRETGATVHRLTVVLLSSTLLPYLVLHTSSIAVAFTHSCFSKDLIFLCY